MFSPKLWTISIELKFDESPFFNLVVQPTASQFPVQNTLQKNIIVEGKSQASRVSGAVPQPGKGDKGWGKGDKVPVDFFDNFQLDGFCNMATWQDSVWTFRKTCGEGQGQGRCFFNERFLEVLKRFDSVNPNFRIWLRVHRCRAVEDWLAF